MLLDNLQRMSDRLIGKYGNTITLFEVTTQGAIDFDTGIPANTYHPHPLKAVAMPYHTSELIPNVIDIDDVRFMIYAFDFKLTKEWYIMHQGDEFAIMHFKKITIQDGNIVYQIQGRRK